MKPFPQSYWVIPSRFCAGHYPGSSDSKEAEAKVKGLLDHGINQIINLVPRDEFNSSGKPFNSYYQAMNEEVLRRDLEVKIYEPNQIWWDGSAPNQESMVYILYVIETALSEGKKVYLHCYGGHGRTSTVVAAYLMKTKGYPVSRAIREACALRTSCPKNHFPFEPCQVRFLHDFWRTLHEKHSN